jgi:hypothetical protein
MSSTQIAVTIVVVIVVVVLALAGWMVMRRRSLRERFGPEYDRAVAKEDSRSAGERELRARERRHAELELRPLPAEAHQRYTSGWEEIQVRFVDSPKEAVAAADALVTRLVAERGYPTGEYEEQVAYLSVEHARTLGYYRDAHEINVRNESGEATTEELRLAFVHYRALFADLLGDERGGQVEQAPPETVRDAPSDTPHDATRQ